jgi:signal recognition particle receptor subunit beta
MVLINKAINEITCKLVYYGPGLCGKTTNLEKIYDNPKMSNKGKMISMSTETDRTLFFDFMPMELGSIGGQKIRVQLYTVPGQVFYDATRKLVLRGADGVVFVADSQVSMKESNIESLENLKTNLRLNRLDPEKIPIVYQLNKRDLPNVSPPEEMREYLGAGDAPVLEATAISGEGVSQTLRAAVALMLDNVKGNVDITLYEGPELKKPDLSAKSGVTKMSAGTPKIGVQSETGSTSVDVPPKAEAAPAPPEAPVAASPFEPEVSPFDDDEPFGEVDAGGLESAESVPLEADPFVTEAPVEAVSDDSPFGETDDVVPPTAAAVSPDHDGLREALTSARELVRQLEDALEAARGHERSIAEKLGE